MHLVIHKEDLARAVGAVAKVVESRTTIPILSNILLDAGDGKLKVTGTDLDIEASTSVEATVNVPGRLTVNAKLLGDLAKKATGDVTMLLDDGRFIVKYGRSRFTLQTLPAEDFPSLTAGAYTAEFDIDLAALFAPVAFAISTEETRYYLNGVFFHNIDGKAVAVATDGHRLARQIGPDAPMFPAVIVPRKTVGLIPKGNVSVSVSAAKIRIVSGDLVLTSKLIDGTFPDYERVIPRSNDKVVTVDRDTIINAADRVATVSSERGRAVRFGIVPGAITLSVSSPDAGTAEDEIEAEYSGKPLDIGFNAQYVRDVFGTLPAGPVRLALADSGSPALVTGGLDGWTGVLMPMRV